MPTLVEIPTKGTVEFPDGMSQDQISSAIQQNYPELKPTTPLAPESKPEPAVKDFALPGASEAEYIKKRYGSNPDTELLGETSIIKETAAKVFPHIAGQNPTSQSVISDVVLSPLRAASLPFELVPAPIMETVEAIGADIANVPFDALTGVRPFAPGESMLPKVDMEPGSSLLKLPGELYNLLRWLHREMF